MLQFSSFVRTFLRQLPTCPLRRSLRREKSILKSNHVLYAPIIAKKRKENHWLDFKERANEWMQVRAPKYSHVYETIKWKNGPIGVFWHKDCM